MNKEQVEVYERLRVRLDVDKLRLTEELMELPQWQVDAGEATAEATRTRDEAKDLVDYTKAEAAANIREEDANAGGKPRSEKQIESEVLLDRDVREALSLLRQADYDVSLWRAVHDGFRTKSSSIRTIADLIQAGYTTPSAIFEERRETLRNGRRKAST
jgi:hypothetical protein